MRLKKIVIVILSIFVLLSAGQSVLAGTLTMTITGVGGSCNNFTLDFNYFSAGTIDDGGGLDYMGIVVYDGDGSALGWIQYFRAVGASSGGTVANRALDGYVGIPDSLPFTLVVYETTVAATDVASASGGPQIYSTTFNPATSGVCTNLVTVSQPLVPSPVVRPPDARINWRFGDLWAVLYRNDDNDGDPAIDVYCYDGQTGLFDFQASSETPNGTQAESCNITFYILDDGSFQFNIAIPEGKEFTVICADLACAAPRMSHFDPNQ